MPSRIHETRRTERGDAGKSILAGLFSLSALRNRWHPPDREPDGRGETGVRSALASLLSLSAAWFPGIRKSPRRGDLKASITAALVHVDRYEDRDTRQPVDADAPGARSVGLSYREIQRRVQAEYPGARISMMTIRSYARDAREEEELALPFRRPNSTRRLRLSRS